jgi:hypothetical protein
MILTKTGRGETNSLEEATFQTSELLHVEICPLSDPRTSLRSFIVAVLYSDGFGCQGSQGSQSDFHEIGLFEHRVQALVGLGKFVQCASLECSCCDSILSTKRLSIASMRLIRAMTESSAIMSKFCTSLVNGAVMAFYSFQATPIRRHSHSCSERAILNWQSRGRTHRPHRETVVAGD